MFGPDLDTTSKQYSRWSAIRWIWVPYRTFFKHRSTFSHGIIFGALLRVIYFLGVITLGAFAVSYAWFSYKGERIGQGRENAKTFLRQNPDMANAIEATIRGNAGIVAAALSNGAEKEGADSDD